MATWSARPGTALLAFGVAPPAVICVKGGWPANHVQFEPVQKFVSENDSSRFGKKLRS